MSEDENVTGHQFKAEIKQLLEILVHSLYKEQDIFLRELVSNASDALTRLSFEMLTNKNVLDADAPLEIRIETPEAEEGEAKKLIIKDTGIGMTREELIQNLGTIAQSGAREFMQRIQDGEVELNDVIGQFGVGFYAVFMVADEVRVVSRSYQKDAEAYAWISTGDDNFRIEPAEKANRGTEIHITLKATATEFAEAYQLRQIVKKHSDFISFPVYVGEEQANQQESLWRKAASEIESDDYHKFYQQMTMDFEEPVTTVHFSSDAPVNVRTLLFVPAKRERNFLSLRKEPGIKLYSNNVLIQEYCTDLLPKWLEFVDGVVDSEDLPLNVSRETVQNNRLMRQLAKTIKGRVLRQLKKVAKDDPEKYAGFWAEYGRVLKEGLAIDPGSKDDIMPLYRNYSSKSNGELMSLDDYIERMEEEQETIYYVLGNDLSSVSNSPHLDPFKSRDIEVLYWVDPLDAFAAPMLTEYKGKKLQNIDDAELELPEADAESEEEESTESTLADGPFNAFVERCVATLGERVTEVRASKVLKDSPVRLVSPSDAANREMERIQRFLNQEYEVPKKIMEINRNHPLIANLATIIEADAEAPLIDLSIEQLFASALIQEGLHPNPADIIPQIHELLGMAAAAEAK